MGNKNTFIFVLLSSAVILGASFITLRSIQKAKMSQTADTYKPSYQEPVGEATSSIDDATDALTTQFDEEQMLFEDEVSDYDILVSEETELDALEETYVKSEF